jgi:HSP20 family protein
MAYLVSPFSTRSENNRELNRFFLDRPMSAQRLENSNWTPQVDVTETQEAFLVTTDVPGVKPEDIEISLHDGVLSIRGERTTKQNEATGTFSRRERVSGAFARQFTLPDTANEESVSAKSVNGVLEITIPKAKKVNPISVTVEGE